MKRSDSDQEAWLKSLGITFVDVFVRYKGEITYEQHVDDPRTLADTVRLSMERRVGAIAVFPYCGMWAVCAPYTQSDKQTRYYDTKEAAEMIAIHNG